MLLASSCMGADAALIDGTCNQSDSTVSCCLKQHPAQYELCGATAPATAEPLIVGPPGLKSLEDETQEESQEEREKRCLPHYVACIEKIGLKPGGSFGGSQCQDCYRYCRRFGFWPLRMNKKKCPGLAG